MLFTTPLAFAALGGLTWGVLGSSMPGMSASITMALLLPFTYTLEPTLAIVMLASCYIGAEYGGSVPAILIRTPGTNAAAATILDGYVRIESETIYAVRKASDREAAKPKL